MENTAAHRRSSVKDTGQTRLDRLIRETCERKGIDLTEFARDVGINRGFLFRIMRGDRPAPEWLIDTLIERYDVSADEARLAAGRIPADIEGHLLNMDVDRINRVRELFFGSSG